MTSAASVRESARFRLIGYREGPDAPTRRLPAAYLVPHLPGEAWLRAVSGSRSPYLKPVFFILDDSHRCCPICFPIRPAVISDQPSARQAARRERESAWRPRRKIP